MLVILEDVGYGKIMQLMMKKDIEMPIALVTACSSFRLLSVATGTWILAGCAPINVESLRTDPGRTYSFRTNTDYQVVYRNISAGFLKCLTGASFRKRFAIRPRIDPASKTASIVYVHHGIWTDYWGLVNIASTAAGTTTSVNTSTLSGVSDLGEFAERWASGSLACQEPGLLTEQFPLLE